MTIPEYRQIREMWESVNNGFGRTTHGSTIRLGWGGLTFQQFVEGLGHNFNETAKTCQLVLQLDIHGVIRGDK